ncbi:MAG: hypothetical protein ABRQ26_05995 [Syntrophomonadaceae bacterium]
MSFVTWISSKIMNLKKGPVYEEEIKPSPGYDRRDYFGYTQPGELIFKVLQCKKCRYSDINNVMTCAPYPTGKPVLVLRVEAECPKFEALITK